MLANQWFVRYVEFSNARTTAPFERASLQELAANILAQTTLGPKGELGLLHDVGERIKTQLWEEVDKHFVQGLNLDAQAESVKRSLLFLGRVGDQRALRQLVPFPQSRIVLNEPGRDQPFQDVAVKQIIRGYGEGMLGCVVEYAAGVSETNRAPQDLETWADCLVEAFGSSPADIRFLTTYIETDNPRAPSAKQLIQAIAARQKQEAD